MKISSFNCFNYKAKTAMVKSLFDKNDIVFLIEHWLGYAEESLLKFVHNDFNIQFESDFANSVSRRGRPFGGRAWITKKTFQYLGIMCIINTYLRLKLILMLNLV